ATMMAPQITTPAGSMGLVFIERKLGGLRLVGHDGGTMSFFSVLLVSLERRWGVFVSYDRGMAGLALSNLFQGFKGGTWPPALRTAVRSSRGPATPRRLLEFIKTAGAPIPQSCD